MLRDEYGKLISRSGGIGIADAVLRELLGPGGGMTGAEARLAVLMTLMRQLQDVMRTENGLLREMRLARLQELQAEKAALAETYELELRRLRQAPELLASLERRPRASCSRRRCASSRRRCGPMPSGCCSRARVVEALVQVIGESLGTASAPAPAMAAGRAPRPTPRRRG